MYYRISLPARMLTVLAAMTLNVLCLSASLHAQDNPPLGGGPQAGRPHHNPDPVAQLRAEISRLRRDYLARIAALEIRLARLEQAPADDLSAGDDLEALRAAARAAARPRAEGQVNVDPSLSAPATSVPAPVADAPRPGSLNVLNPEISLTGNVLAVASDRGRESLEIQEFELDLQAALDPFSRTRLTVAMHGEEVEIEEGYVVYPSLPGGLELTFGKFRQQFGVLNRQHLHALPQTELPAVLTTVFGAEGLAQTGISLRWLLPRPWAGANEITLQLTDGSNEAFGGEDFEHLSVLAHLKNFWEAGAATWFEWGLSGAAGKTHQGGDSRVWGTDLTYHWQPPARAKYRELTWRTEVLLARRDDRHGSAAADAWGGYSYLEVLAARNLYFGIRYDDVADPVDCGGEACVALRRRSFVPYLSWWQSELVRLRAEYQRLERDAGDTENRFVLQLTWAAGPHKHESY